MRCYQSEKNAERQIAHTHDTSKAKISNSLEPSQKTIFCLYIRLVVLIPTVKNLQRHFEEMHSAFLCLPIQIIGGN